MDGRKIQKWDGEAKTHERVAQWLKRNHPNVIFRTDFAAGIKLPPWIAKRQRILQHGRGFPDIFVFYPTRHPKTCEMRYGLALELKAKGVPLKWGNGNWAEDHYREQYEVLKTLSERGYACSFAVGYDEAIAVLKWYLEGTEEIQFTDFIPKITLGEVTNIEEAF